MSDEYTRVQTAAAFVRARVTAAPEIAIVLGSGLGDFASHVEGAAVLPYEQVPGWPPKGSRGSRRAWRRSSVSSSLRWPG